MWLLNTKTLKLHEFVGNNVPKYVILSHRWGDQEVSHAEMSEPSSAAISKSGYKKIAACCEIAANLPIPVDWIWIDTCCIDKTSSAELSEAINSMFSWYERSDICIVYLQDVQTGLSDEALSTSSVVSFEDSDWFSRGWTLQELLAPTNVIFFGKDWKLLGTKFELVSKLHEITGISEAILDKTKSISDATVAQRMSWAGLRSTTRPEDIAYCLLGLFNVNMPLLYGEGEQKAFLRLQEEILKSSSDHTIFAWAIECAEDGLNTSVKPSGLLAPHPRGFLSSKHFEPFLGLNAEALLVSATNIGLSLQIPVYADNYGALFGTLNCCEFADEDYFACIHLLAIDKERSQYCRIRSQSLSRKPMRGQVRRIFVRNDPIIATHRQPNTHWVRFVPKAWPPNCYADDLALLIFPQTLVRPLASLHSTRLEPSTVGRRQVDSNGKSRQCSIEHLWCSCFSLALSPNEPCLAIRFIVPPARNASSVFKLIIGRAESGAIGTACYQYGMTWEEASTSSDKKNLQLTVAPTIYRLPDLWRLVIEIQAQRTKEPNNDLDDQFDNASLDDDSEASEAKSTHLVISLVSPLSSSKISSQLRAAGVEQKDPIFASPASRDGDLTTKGHLSKARIYFKQIPEARKRFDYSLPGVAIL